MLFRRLFKTADLCETAPASPEKLKVIWDNASGSDYHALLTAVAMLFKRSVPLSTDDPLTSHDRGVISKPPDS